MSPAVRDIIDALIGVALFFAAQALVSDAEAAIEEKDDMQVIRRYFIAEGPKAKKVAKEGLKLANDSCRAGIDLAKRFGALGTFGHRHTPPYALVWDEGLVPDQNPGFLPPELHLEGSNRYYTCRPDKRTRLGKEIHDALRALPVFSFSDYACKEFGVQHSTIGGSDASRSGMAMYHSVAGYMKKKLVFSIPFGGDQGGGKVIDVKIPQEFREITAGQFIDITGEGGAS
jgi:hypothetical protein